MFRLIFTFSILFLTANLVSSQNVPIDFESGGNGDSWTWTVFENDANPALEIVANPDPIGVNTSAIVAKFTALQLGNPWAGCESMHGSDIGSFSLTPSTSIIKIMVWKNVVSDVGIKLVESSSASLGEIKVPNTVVGQWEELTFDFSAMEGITYDQIVIFPDFEARIGDNIIYFDNISFNPQGGPPPAPMVAAPTPPHDSVNVISLFSDSYSDETVDTWQASWSVGTGTEVSVAGNPTKRYLGVEFVGVEFLGNNSVDVSEMDSFHVDVWTPNMTEFRMKLVDFGVDNAFAGGDDVEHEITYSNPSLNTWIRYAIPLDDFTGLTTSEHLSQLVFAGLPATGGTFYLDNVYFSKVATDTTDTTGTTGIPDIDDVSITIYPNPASENLTVKSNKSIEQIQVFNILGEMFLQVNPTATQTALQISDLPSGPYLVKVFTKDDVVASTIVVR